LIVRSKGSSVQQKADRSRRIRPSSGGAERVPPCGRAVISHGGERTTKGIDLFVDPSPDNIARL
jgi:hypothetical protein